VLSSAIDLPFDLLCQILLRAVLKDRYGVEIPEYTATTVNNFFDPGNAVLETFLVVVGEYT